jgi:pimeloyl-ACP methyl ester carboxylesterase
MGSGPPLLLIHGLMTTSYSWRYVMEPLARHARVIAPDLVGCGRSEKVTNRSYAVRRLAEWIGELQRALGIRGCAVVGNSMGGYLCRRLALDDPASMSHLVDIHSPVFSELRYGALHAAMSVPGSKTILSKLIARDPHRWAHRNVHYFDESLKSLEEAREYGDPLSTPEGARCFARYLQETMSPEGFREMERDLFALANEKKDFPVPLTLVYAQSDPVVKPENGARMSRLFPRAKMHWLQDSSHFPQVDCPERVVEIIRACLA